MRVFSLFRRRTGKPLLTFIWNYRQEARTAESLRRKFQEIAHRTGPTGDPNCPPYIIKAKQIYRQLAQMIDASSGGLEAKRSEDGLSDASDSEDAGGVDEFDKNVINEMNNAAGNCNGGGRMLMRRKTPTRGRLMRRATGSLLL